MEKEIDYIELVDNKINILANKKSVFDKEILISRLNSFPLSWLNNIKTIHSVDITKEMVERLTYDILLEEDNSLRI